MTRHSLETYARAERWPLTRTLALPGLVRGNALRAWGVQVRRRFGADAPGRVRAVIGVDADALPDEPTKKHWLPVHAQIRLVQAVIDELLGGDAMAFESIFEDTTGAAERMLHLAGRMAGPALVLRMAGNYHASVCNVGTCSPSVDGGTARLVFRGAEVFGHPTWRFVQMAGMRGMFATLKRSLETIEGDSDGDQDFTIHMRWK